MTKLTQAKSRALKIALLQDVKNEVQIDGHIGLIMSDPENIDQLNIFDVLLYKEFRREIKSICRAHNALFDSQDAFNQDKRVLRQCEALESAVIALCDVMNDCLDSAFADLASEVKKAAKNKNDDQAQCDFLAYKQVLIELKNEEKNKVA